MKTVAIIGAFDTKGQENNYLREQIEARGVHTILIDMGIMGDPAVVPDISAEVVAQAADKTLQQLRKSQDRSMCLKVMGMGAGKILMHLLKEKKIDGVIAIGGGQGTLMGATAMRVLPIGLPKVLLSTIALLKDSDAPFSGIKDTMVMNPQVDVSGLNSMMRLMLKKSASALCGMVCSDLEEEKVSSRLCIGMTMFGVTTPCVTRVRELLEEKGYEVMVFHATGAGGPMMETLIRDDRIHGVADITLSEIAHYIVGGSGSGGKNRLLIAGEKGIPQVIVPGALDCINFMPPDSMPEKFSGRRTHMHNENLKVMRTSVEENVMFGEIIAQKLNQAKGEVVVFLPEYGVSANDNPNGGDFWDPEADHALFTALENNLTPEIDCKREPFHINDDEFAKILAERLDAMMKKKYQTGERGKSTK